MKHFAYCLFIAVLLIPDCGATQTKFVTHGLIILVDIYESADKSGALLREVDYAFEASIPFIIPGRMLYEFITISKSTFESSYSNFRFFELPRGGLSNIQLYLCYPKKLLKNQIKFVSDPFIKEESSEEQDFMPAQVTEIEKQCGLLLGHFKEVEMLNINDFKNKLASESWMDKNTISTSNPPKEYLTVARAAQSLRYVLKRLFVVNSFYTNQAPPSWMLYFSGHGDQYIPQKKDLLVKNYEKGNLIDFLAKRGTISCLDTDIFSRIISDLSQRITIRFIDISTCYGGGINVGDLLRQVETGVIPPYKFIIGAHTLVGDMVVDLEKQSTLNAYFKTFFDLDFTEPDIDWGKVGTNAARLSRAYKKINAAYQPVYDSLSHAFAQLRPELKKGPTSDFNNIPVYKPIEANYFVEIPYPWLIRIGKKEIETCKNGVLNIPKTVKTVLLYANTIPCTIQQKDFSIFEITLFLSAIPGDTFHIIEKFQLENKDEPLDVRRLIVEFSGMRNLRARKLFYIKHLDNALLSTNNDQVIFEGSGELMITTDFDPNFDKQSVKTLLFSRDQKKYCRGSNFDFEVLSEENAIPLIENFEEEVEWLKKLAFVQEPYRFLKDAVIETTSWKKPLEDLVPDLVSNEPQAYWKKPLEDLVPDLVSNEPQGYKPDNNVVTEDLVPGPQLQSFMQHQPIK
ncbi:TPA: hypothetical protein DDZ86_03685 [Candidatus Dependentiae bacterium]|nr:MAG: hypothetical protein UW09_C0003G0090 [candidate division TM6 bacterium GW2011_GWF2_43_87]HBL98717.1 hypothetical protein [Candidatus Dependentiae bacterium]